MAFVLTPASGHGKKICSPRYFLCCPWTSFDVSYRFPRHVRLQSQELNCHLPSRSAARRPAGGRFPDHEVLWFFPHFSEYGNIAAEGVNHYYRTQDDKGPDCCEGEIRQKEQKEYYYIGNCCADFSEPFGSVQFSSVSAEQQHAHHCHKAFLDQEQSGKEPDFPVTGGKTDYDHSKGKFVRDRIEKFSKLRHLIEFSCNFSIKQISQSRQTDDQRSRETLL